MKRIFFLIMISCAFQLHGTNYSKLLKVALFQKNIDLITDVLSHGADPNVRVDTDRNTGLMIAAENGDMQIVKLLLTHKADTTLQNIYGHTVLMIAAEYNQPDIVRLLLQYGADPLIMTANGTTIFDEYKIVRDIFSGLGIKILHVGASQEASPLGQLPAELIDLIKQYIEGPGMPKKI